MARKTERGTLALFGIMMAVVFMTVGGISIELWNVLSQRRQLSAAADAAVAAGASAVDQDSYRLDGTLVLLPELAQERAAASLARQDLVVDNLQVRLDADFDSVSVELEGDVDLLILKLIGADPIRVGVAAQAGPFRGS